MAGLSGTFGIAARNFTGFPEMPDARALVDYGVRMEELGFVSRTRLDHDARRLRVALTPRSRALAARLAPQVEATYAEIERTVGRPFLRQLYATLDDLAAKLGPAEASGDDG